MNKFLLSVMAACVLAACGNGAPEQQQSAVPTQNNPAVSGSQPAATPVAPTTIDSSDNKVVFTPDAEFEDKTGDTAVMPADVDAQNVTLLQYDAARNLTLSAINEGKAKDAAKFLGNLKTAVEADKNLKNVKIGEVVDQKLSYSFTDGVNNEACISALNADSNITTVCATSPDVSGDGLQQFVANTVQFK